MMISLVMYSWTKTKFKAAHKLRTHLSSDFILQRRADIRDNQLEEHHSHGYDVLKQDDE